MRRRALVLGLLVVAGVIAYLYLGRRDPQEGGIGAELGPDGDPPRKAGAGIIPELLDLLPGVSREEAEELASVIIPGMVETETERPPVTLTPPPKPAPVREPPPDTIQPITYTEPRPITQPIVKSGPIVIGGGASVTLPPWWKR